MMYVNTVTPFLHDCLLKLMRVELFSKFRLVGGTALSLQLGHRKSVDIDLFSDLPYGTIDFEKIEDFLSGAFDKVDFFADKNPGFGKSYTIENRAGQSVKLDVFYTDDFIFDPVEINQIRMAGTAEIAAMKMDVIQRGGRKKDFWDIHELLRIHDLPTMIAFHKERYPYIHESELLKTKLTDFLQAEDDFDPICLRGKYWEFIKEDLEEEVAKLPK
jgi:hypothetical protein